MVLSEKKDLYHRIRIKTEEKTKVVATVWGTEFIQFIATLAIFLQDDLKKKRKRKTATGQNGCCFGKMDDHPVHTIPNHQPIKMDVLTTTFFLQIILSKWLLRHSSTSPNQQRRPLPSLLSVYFFYGFRSRTPWRPSVIMTTIIGQLDCWQLQLSGIEKYLNMSGILPRTLIGGRNELRTLIGCRNEG